MGSPPGGGDPRRPDHRIPIIGIETNPISLPHCGVEVSREGGEGGGGGGRGGGGGLNSSFAYVNPT